MKALSEIQIDFERAMGQAAELEEAASEMRRAANRDFEVLLQDISSAWKGEAATDYIRKGRLLKERICKNADDLSKVAAVIRNTAQRYYDAEMRSREIAEQRQR